MCDHSGVAEASEAPNEQGLEFLRDLIDRYGVDGLTERLAAAIKEAEARVPGPALDTATAWLEREQGHRIASVAGEARLTLSASGAGAPSSGGTAHLSLTASGAGAPSAVATAHLSFTAAGTAGDAVVHKFAQDVVTATDQVTVTVTEAAQVVATTGLPTNTQVAAQLHEVFWYLVGVWGLLDMPTEAVTFMLLLTLAIVVVRIRLKQG